MIPIAKLETKNKPYDKIPHIVYFEPYNGIGFVPTEYVDITDFIEIKKAMCYEHQSQISWMQDNYKDTVGESDFFEGVITTAKYRGAQCGVKYAEGFRMAKNIHCIPPYRILP